MNYRLATVFAEKEFTADATEIIDVNIADPVSELIVRFQIENGDEGASTGHPVKCLEKIELVDGSDVLFSLSGAEAHALDWYNHQISRPNIMWYLGGETMDCALHISFGRFAMDPVLAFDPKKFRNPQLKITIDKDGGGVDSQGVTVSVFARTFDDKKIEPIGFLMSKEVKDYNIGDGLREYTDLPTDYPYRKLLLRSQTETVGVEHTFDEIKLSEDNDKKIPLNHKIEEILHAITAYGKAYQEWIITCGHTAFRNYHCTPGYWPGFAAAGWTSSTTIQSANVYEGDGGRFKLISTTAGLNQQVHCRGWCPHSTIEIPFGMQDDIDDWYDVTGLGSLRLNMKCGASRETTETCQIFLQQLRKYAE